LRSTAADIYSRIKGNISDLRKRLNGRIEYELPNDNINSFHGYIKLKRDPAGENITINNIFPRESQLIFTEWLFGLVIYTGNNTKIY